MPLAVAADCARKFSRCTGIQDPRAAGQLPLSVQLLGATAMQGGPTSATTPPAPPSTPAPPKCNLIRDQNLANMPKSSRSFACSVPFSWLLHVVLQSTSS